LIFLPLYVYIPEKHGFRKEDLRAADVQETDFRAGLCRNRAVRKGIEIIFSVRL